jgi:hypothetical protein
VKNELLQWTVELEKRGINGEDMNFDEKEKQLASHRHQSAACDDDASHRQPPDKGESEQKAEGQPDQADDERASKNTLPVTLKLRLLGLALKKVPA